MKLSLPRFFTDQGGNLPAAGEKSRGVIAIKRAASTEDEVHIGLLDSSNASVWRRLLTKTYGDTLYSAIGHDHDSDYAALAHNHDDDYAPLQPRTFKAVYPTPSANTFTLVGIAGFSSGGTLGDTDGTDGPWTSFTTGSISGDAAGYNTDPATWIDWDPTIIMHMGNCAGTTTRRIWCGLFESTPSASDDPAIDGCGFRYSTSASDTNWQAWSNDGTSGGTITDTGVAFAANTPFKMEMRCTSGQIEFYIDDALEATHSTNLPASSTDLAFYYRLTTLTNASRAMSVGKYELWHNP